MSSPNLDLPMLKPFLLGEVMSDHNGVRCYPAISRGTEEKYIVKVISVPASPAKLDALLLTGAMPDREAALSYFRSLSEDVIRQTNILRELSHQEGFVPYSDGQIVAKDDGTGYDVILLGTYRNTLERMLRTEVMTHAGVADLALDLCAALAACRRAGFVYVDLKPGNIFRDPGQGFRIGDVGFIALPSLKYASLPEKYRSSYTAPELSDDMAVLNDTVDIYALGLVLYQAYNGGVLPFMEGAEAEILPPPVYADYEMAKIIAKACHPDPKERWQEPTKMAHAIIDYLQTYGAPETPLIPPTLDKQEEPEEEPFEPEADPEQLQQELADLENADPDELAFLSGLISDETAPTEENTADVSADVMTEELSEILAQVDELVLHQLPQPPVAPAPVFTPMPEPIPLEEDIPEAPCQDVPAEEAPIEEAAPVEEPPQPAIAVETKHKVKAMDPDEQPLPEKAKWPRIVAAAVVVILLLGCWFIGRHHYGKYYLLTVDSLVLQQERDTVTVQIGSSIDEQLLQVICTDSYGNSATSPVSGGIAVFTDLHPNTHYEIRVEVSGWHKLLGATKDSFTTPAQTQIHSFTAGIGPEDGSVLLNFTLSGPESSSWTVVYSADGIAEQSLSFTGRSALVSGLVPGAVYTFTLTSPDGLYLAGQTQVQFTATNILYAQDLTITACGGGSLTAQWAQPSNGTVTQWQVRCYNESGYNVTITTSDLYCTFTDLGHSTPCTVEVTAVGMNRSTSTTISADPVTVESYACGFTQDGALQLSWQYSGQAPAEGWILHCLINGEMQLALPLESAAANLLAIPGANYYFILEAANGSHIFNSSYQYTAEEVTVFSAYGVTTADMIWSLCLWAEGGYDELIDIPAENHKTTFTVGEQAGFYIGLWNPAEASEEPVCIQFVFHDANGCLIRSESTTLVWDAMWQDGYCLLPIPIMPDSAGSYTMNIFFDGCFVHRQELTVVEPELPEEPLAN